LLNKEQLIKERMTKYLKTAAAVGALAFAATQASAVPISGTINFGNIGIVALTGGATFTTATGLDFTPDCTRRTPSSIVTSGDGSFAVVVPIATTASFKDFNFGGGNLNEWTLSSGQFAFDLTTSAKSGTTTDTFLNVSGTGFVKSSIAGLDTTPGFFSLTASRSFPGQLTFSFQASTSTIPPDDNRVPDGGATAVLLGLGVLGLTVAKRRA